MDVLQKLHMTVKASSDVARCGFLMAGTIPFPMQTPMQVEAHHVLLPCYSTMEDKGVFVLSELVEVMVLLSDYCIPSLFPPIP